MEGNKEKGGKGEIYNNMSSKNILDPQLKFTNRQEIKPIAQENQNSSKVNIIDQHLMIDTK